jgi:hypothetical protein
MSIILSNQPLFIAANKFLNLTINMPYFIGIHRNHTHYFTLRYNHNNHVNVKLYASPNVLLEHFEQDGIIKGCWKNFDDTKEYINIFFHSNSDTNIYIEEIQGYSQHNYTNNKLLATHNFSPYKNTNPVYKMSTIKMSDNFFTSIESPVSIITPISAARTFPEFMQQRIDTYANKIDLFSELIKISSSSAELLKKIRTKEHDANTRMALLKLFRRCVSPVCDTESTKKINTYTNDYFIENFGHTFKTIDKLKSQFSNISASTYAALSTVLGEYDNRGQEGYILTDMFFNWAEAFFDGEATIEGPRGAGKDIQLSSLFADFNEDFPCDFVIKDKITNKVLAVGFARYDSTRGGSQSDDRTGGNSDKVNKAAKFCEKTGHNFKIIFLADGPGLVHSDTWKETCTLDGRWNGNVRVTTLKTAEERLNLDWIRS